MALSHKELVLFNVYITAWFCTQGVFGYSQDGPAYSHFGN